MGSLRALLQNPRQLAAVFAPAIGGAVSFCVYRTSMQKYMGLSDKIGRRKVMLFFSISGTIITAPVLTLLAETTYVFAAFGMMFGLVFVSRLPLPQESSGRLLAGDEEALAELATAGWIEAVGTRTPRAGFHKRTRADRPRNRRFWLPHHAPRPSKRIPW